MKIKHSISVSEDEINALFNIVRDTALVTYPTVEDQALALDNVKVKFAELLQQYITTAFKTGKKIGKSSADLKDTKMYKTET